MPSKESALTELVEERIRHYQFHSHRFWVWNGWIVGWTLVANILVPFGLAALLYVPTAWHRLITVILLGVSGVALALQLLTNIQRFRERALHLRRLHHTLQTSLADYRVGIKTEPELSAILGETERMHAQEVAP
jgi:hypothetical protein